MAFILEIIGTVVLVVVVYLILRFLWSFLYTSFIGDAMGRIIKLEEMGEWAVITGASDGIGKAYAEEIASLGINVVLISRSPKKLKQVASEISGRCKVETRVIDVDFTNGREIYDRISKETEGLEVGILINNVGMSYCYPEYLTMIENGSQFAQSLINSNVTSVTMMSMMFLPQMAQRRKGLILNVSSASAVLPTPLLTMYSSTKAFVHKFSRDLALECREMGVTVQCILPGFVATKMSRIRRPSLTAPTPGDYVKWQVKTLGFELDSPGYWIHKLQLGWYSLIGLVFPRLLINVLYVGALKLREGGRRRAMRASAASSRDQETKLVS